MQRVLSFPVTRGFGDSSEFVTKRMCFSFMFSIGFLALLSGFLLGRFAFDQELTLTRKLMRQSNQRSAPNQDQAKNSSDVEDSLFSKPFSEEALMANLKSLEEASHTSVNSSLGQAIMLRDFVEQAGFELVSPLRPVFVPLAYPDPSRPNKAVVLDGSGGYVVSCSDSRPPFVGAADRAVAASLSSATIKGEPVYVNFGRDEDYLYLDSVDITVAGRVVLARAGGLPARDLVATALDHDAVAVLLYLDPAQKDLAPELLSASELAALQPERLSTNSDVSSENVSAPILVISTRDAELILQYMEGREASPASWRGGLSCAYPLGPGFSEAEWTIEVQIHTASVVHTSYDVVAAIRGSKEPDRLVVVGTGPQAAGSAALMQLATHLGSLKTKGWRPHRSVAVAFFGQINEDVRRSLLCNQVVAFLDLDVIALSSPNSTIRGTALLSEPFERASSLLGGGVTLDTVLPVGHAAALDRSGVPFIQLQPDGSVDEKAELLLSRVGEVGSVWGQVAWQVASSPALPYSLDPYVTFLNHTMAVLNQRFQVVARRHKLFLETLTETVNELVATILAFQLHWREVAADPHALRRMNDQLVAFSRALSCPRAADPLPQRANLLLTRHVLFSRSRTGSDATAGLGELQDLLRAMTSTAAPEDLQRQIVTLLTDAMKCLRNATFALSDTLDTIVLGKT